MLLCCGNYSGGLRRQYMLSASRSPYKDAPTPTIAINRKNKIAPAIPRTPPSGQCSNSERGGSCRVFPCPPLYRGGFGAAKIGSMAMRRSNHARAGLSRDVTIAALVLVLVVLVVGGLALIP